MIIFKNISKIYGENTVALDNISFEIKSGEFVLIIGKSGAGKTTVLKILRREEEPTKGNVFYKNRNLLEIPHRRLGEIRRKIAIIHQDFKLLEKRTVLENIALPLEIASKMSFKDIKNEVIKIAERLRLKRKLNQIVKTLSGGEKQKVCLARSLIMKPEVLLADEPTGNLDILGTFEILEILKNLNNDGITIVLATHNKDIVETLKTRVLTFNNGRLIKDENPGTFSLL
ncbi:MAG: cell division ATP-binding protein FtsE [Candidatus Parcubacteria bacterium]|nr:MAG: cell division ATP-binding protein FtsE [Candidatus Parcubacteria bacterium]